MLRAALEVIRIVGFELTRVRLGGIA